MKTILNNIHYSFLHLYNYIKHIITKSKCYTYTREKNINGKTYIITAEVTETPYD